MITLPTVFIGENWKIDANEADTMAMMIVAIIGKGRNMFRRKRNNNEMRLQKMKK